MKLLRLMYVLYKISFFSPRSLYYFVTGVFKYGINKLANILQVKMKLQEGEKVAFLCKNHASLIKAIFAVSRLGTDIYFINAEIGESQFQKLVNQHQFDLLIYDEQLKYLAERMDYCNRKILSYHKHFPSISNLLLDEEKKKKSDGLKVEAGNETAKRRSIIKAPAKRTFGGRIIIQTSGSTGIPKAVPHKVSLFNYLNPFAASSQAVQG